MNATAGIDRDTFVVGAGACTSVGASLLASAAAVRAGVASFDDHPFMVDSIGQPMIVSRASYLSDDVVGPERLLSLARSAAAEALAVLQPMVREMGGIPAVVGLPLIRPGVPAAIERDFPRTFRKALADIAPVSTVDVITRGHASGLMALDAGRNMIRKGIADFCLIGGVDSYLEPETLEWLEASDQLHSSGPANNAWGFVPGEGAGFCLLASSEAANRSGLRPYGRILSVAVTRESNLIKTETICLGHGLTAAFESACRPLHEPDEKVDEIICDMNGEPYRAEEFGFATIRTNHRFVNSSDFQAPADCWGDVGAASGPLFINVSAIRHQKGYGHGSRTLAWASSESGERAAAIIEFSAGATAGRSW
jgi:3-oxoacyl-[acyl-carrier-protein] synthase I